MIARTTAPIILNDVCPPLILFKAFLDRLLCNKGYEPLTEVESACLEGGAIALTNALVQLQVLHDYIDALEMVLPKHATKQVIERCGLAIATDGDDQ